MKHFLQLMSRETIEDVFSKQPGILEFKVLSSDKDGNPEVIYSKSKMTGMAMREIVFKTIRIP